MRVVIYYRSGDATTIDVPAPCPPEWQIPVLSSKRIWWDGDAANIAEPEYRRRHFTLQWQGGRAFYLEQGA